MFPADKLLPNEPRILDLAAEQARTDRFLLPALAEIEALFLFLRARLDPVWSKVRPVKLGKAYPLGQCLEISLAVQIHLQQLDGRALTGAPARGYRALADFLAAGGTMRQVWGDLRGEYFQNAYLAGTLYIDCANDTVVPTKPKVEILPLEKARFTPVTDFLHFARVAASYWKAMAFPNHVLPELAPWCPLILAIPGAGVQVHSLSNYMLSLARADGFRASEAVLDRPPLDPALFRLLAGQLGASGVAVPPDAAAGRAAALLACRSFRAGERHRCERMAANAAAAASGINRHLVRLKVEPAAARRAA